MQARPWSPPVLSSNIKAFRSRSLCGSLFISDREKEKNDMKEISWKELQCNPMSLIGDSWMLITAGSEAEGYNTMTASWGQLGSLWGEGKTRPVATVYIRPQRYTKQFVDRSERFTLSFMGDGCKKQTGYLGSVSGKDEDKLAKVGFRPLFLDGTTAIEGAELILVCRKLARMPLKEEHFTDASLVDFCYPERDFHDIYVGEIERVLVKD